MATVIHRTTKQLLQSVHTPDFPVVDWILNPDLSPVAGVEPRYWKIVGDAVLPMDAGERAAVDAAALTTSRTQAKAAAKAAIDGLDGYVLRAMAANMLSEVNDLRTWITSFKAAVAAASSLTDLKNRVAALPNVPQRTVTQAKTAYKALLDGSTLDE